MLTGGLCVVVGKLYDGGVGSSQEMPAQRPIFVDTQWDVFKLCRRTMLTSGKGLRSQITSMLSPTVLERTDFPRIFSK